MATKETAHVRTLVSPMRLRSRRGRTIYWTVFTLTVAGFTFAFLFPIYWMVTGAFKSPDELLQSPPTYVPNEWHPDNYSEAWRRMDLAGVIKNTVLQAGGAWLFQIVLCTAAAYALSKLKPVFGQIILGAILATLMVPASALLVPKYLTAVDVPVIGTNLLNTPWAIWLPSVANAFNLYLLKRFFDQLPNDVLEAAAIDGAGPLRRLWYIVLPMSRPVLGVVSIFAVVAVWQDFLWPLLVYPDTDKQPVSVALVQLSASLPLTYLIAAMVIASIPMVAVFLVFQRHIIAGISAGSVKE
ncbi:carbohydrate ABC transporter permease [Streptodolium elevatio]|uniref:Carbohydrate ABC transporter permease n=1 Tax=Streptodolium elevatio TaxID=3157996 RepID=A0ABV3DPT7_9ACTN